MNLKTHKSLLIEPTILRFMGRTAGWTEGLIAAGAGMPYKRRVQQDQYVPEYESFKQRLLEIAQIRSVDALLRRVVTWLAERPHVALARVWLVDKGDVCAHCRMRPWCRDPSFCLHLVASAGRPTPGMGEDWGQLEGAFRRIPWGVGHVGTVAATAGAVVIEDAAPGYVEFHRPDWARRERIRGFNGQPILFSGDLLGVLAVFTRIPTPQEGPIWLRIFADHIAAALRNARAFEEIERLKSQLELQNRYLRQEVEETQAAGGIIGRSAGLQQVLQQAARVAPTEATVLILGESGTGKELVAREIHRQSGRAHQPMIRVNCASVPHELYESEFFGHVKGAFTGALKDRAGRFEAADGGTLFLDEVGEIPLELQSKFLRVLQEKQYERVGDDRTRSVDVRIIAATNRDLAAAVASGRFRSDLYYRLNVFPISVPPLRQRREDVWPLARAFLEQAAQRLKRPPPPLSQEQIRQLESYAWPGNVRELQNVVERAAILAMDGPLKFDLTQDIGIGAVPASARAEAAVSHPREAPADGILTQAEIERRELDNLQAVLQRSRGKIHGPGGAAEMLGVKPTTLMSRLKRLGLRPGR
jgi:transcriptional regulator with GAF, ATPase, and Fis domain